jgi:hypothetical protein
LTYEIGEKDAIAPHTYSSFTARYSSSTSSL